MIVGRTSLRLVAALIVVLVCADVTLDAACDPIGLSGTGASVSFTIADSQDACAGSCLPDCFCCSRSETAGPALTLPEPNLLRQTAVAIPGSVTAGIRPVFERPPLARF